MKNKKRKLNDGKEIPIIGLGTHKMQNAVEVICESIRAGVRLIDTGTRYKNQEIVGEGVKKALKEGLVDRDDLCIVGKVWLQDRIDPEKALRYTLDCFGINYIDIYLDHWPYGKDYRPKKVVEEANDPFNPIPIYDVWPKMEKLVEDNLAGSIGVSNYNVQALCNLLSFCNTKPVVNEVEFNPFYYQKNLKEFCDKEDIAIIAYTPLVNGIVARTYNAAHNDEYNVFKEQIIKDMAKKYTKTEGQIILNWEVSLGVIPIPATSQKWRMRENLGALDFNLKDKDLERLNNQFLTGRKKKFVVGNKYFGVNILG